MSIQVIPQLGDIGSQLGSGIGQGLSEQLPKEIERYRLSQGIKDLAKKGGNLSALDQLAELSGIPGMNPQLLSSIQPLIENQQRRNEFLKGQTSPAQPASQTQVKTGQIGAMSPQELRQPKSEWEPLSGTTQAIETRAAQRLVEQPQRFKTPEQAIAFEKERVSNQQAIIGEVDSQLDKNLQETLEKAGAGVYGDIPGEMLQRARIKAYQKAEKDNISPKKVAQEAAGNLLEFAKQRGTLKKVGDLSFLSTTPAKNRQAIQGIKNAYDDAGESRLFADDLMSSQNLSRPYANYLANPPSKDVRGILETKGHVMLSKDFVHKDRKGKEKFFDKILENKSQDDSLFSLGLVLQNKGYDPSEFLERAEQLYREKNLPLSERQQSEIGQPWPVRRSLGDLYLFPLIGLGKLVGEK